MSEMQSKKVPLTTLVIEGVGGVGGADGGGEDVGALSKSSAFGSIDMILFILLLAFSGLPKQLCG